jgi:hypothetical protein
MTAERRSREGPAFSSLKAALGAGWVCAIGADWLGEGRLVDGFSIHTVLRSVFRAPFLDRNQIPHSPQDKTKFAGKACALTDCLRKVHFFAWHRW